MKRNKKKKEKKDTLSRRETGIKADLHVERRTGRMSKIRGKC